MAKTLPHTRIIHHPSSKVNIGNIENIEKMGKKDKTVYSGSKRQLDNYKLRKGVKMMTYSPPHSGEISLLAIYKERGWFTRVFPSVRLTLDRHLTLEGNSGIAQRTT